MSRLLERNDQQPYVCDVRSPVVPPPDVASYVSVPSFSVLVEAQVQFLEVEVFVGVRFGE